MDDRVGDILAQRAKLESGAGAAIFLSVLLHATITSIAAWTAWHHVSTAATPVMIIRLAQQLPTAVMTPAAPPVAAAQPKAKPIAKPKPLDKKKTAPPSPFGRSTKKPAEVSPPATPYPPPAAAPPAPPATATAPDVPVGGTGVTGLEGGDFPYPLYVQQMIRLIGSHWTRPAGANDLTTATVYFMINTDGTVHDVKLEMPSGNTSYDLAAQRAVLEAGTLPPLPFGYSGRYLGVHLKFR